MNITHKTNDEYVCVCVRACLNTLRKFVHRVTFCVTCRKDITTAYKRKVLYLVDFFYKIGSSLKSVPLVASMLGGHIDEFGLFFLNFRPQAFCRHCWGRPCDVSPHVCRHYRVCVCSTLMMNQHPSSSLF